MRQHEGKKNCGVIAVAVIAEVPLEVAEVAVEKKGCTTTKDLARGLRRLGFDCPDRCQRKPRPQLGIGHLSDPKRKHGWHWVVIDGDKIYDGISGFPDGTVEWKKGWKLTSYLPVTKRMDT